MTDQRALDRYDLNCKHSREAQQHEVEGEVREPSSPPDGG